MPLLALVITGYYPAKRIGNEKQMLNFRFLHILTLDFTHAKL